jgi:hypothetical protein
MLRPYSRVRSVRPPCALDRWTGEGWTLLERHEVRVAAGVAAEAVLPALSEVRLRELPAVRALFRLRRVPFAAEMTVRQFFSTAPFVLLEDEPGREWVAGAVWARQAPAPAEWHRAAAQARMAAVVNFRAEPGAAGVTLWTETWVRTHGRVVRVGFGAYWLAIGPWSAWIRRMILRAARRRAETAGD